MTEQKFKISVVGCSCFEVGGSYDQCDILPPIGSKPIVEPTSIHRIVLTSNKLPPSEASLSLIRESRHLVLVLPTNGLDTCINRLLIIIILNLVLIIFFTRFEGKEVEDDLLYSEILAALAAGTKIIPVTADFQVFTFRH